MNVFDRLPLFFFIILFQELAMWGPTLVIVCFVPSLCKLEFFGIKNSNMIMILFQLTYTFFLKYIQSFYEVTISYSYNMKKYFISLTNYAPLMNYVPILPWVFHLHFSVSSRISTSSICNFVPESFFQN